jgi:SAM-dependent methyltransferase
MDEEEKYWRDFEKVYVHNVYECISSKIDEFEEISKNNPKKTTDSAENGTDINSKDNLFTAQNKDGLDNRLRIKNEKSHQPWPKVKKFLLKLEPNSLIADIGCGEGKYLNINTESFTIGCDRSISLAKLAAFRHQQTLNQNQVTICDNLNLPYRSDLFDAVISIGVIHHISTHKRRVKAVQELNRILTTGGKLMIYVWAMEQRIRKFNSQDVLVPTLSTSFKKKTKSINEETEKTYQGKYDKYIKLIRIIYIFKYQYIRNKQ